MEMNTATRTGRRSGEPPKAQFCMICLATNEGCRLHPVNNFNLHLEYEQLTGISLQGEMTFIPQFCSECVHRLRNCSKFRDKSMRSYHLLLGLVEINKSLSTKNIRRLCRSNKLTPTLAMRSYQPDHYDFHLIHEELQEQEMRIQREMNNKPMITQPEEPIKMEVKMIQGKLIVNPVPKEEGKIEVEFDTSQVVQIKSPKSEKDDYDEEYLECIDDDVMYSDNEIDKQGDERVKHTVDKFMNDVMNDTDNDWDFLKDSDSDSDSDVGDGNVKPPVEVHGFKPIGVKKNKKQMKGENLEYLNQYNVTHLSPEEQLEDIQKRKEKDSFKNSQYKCMKCFKGFISVNTYNAHMEKHTDKYGKFECPLCGLRFTTNSRMRGHMTGSHSTRYSCTSCPLVTNHDQAAINHAKWHNGTVYTCPHCFEKQRSRSGYMSHLRILHPTDVVCTLCGYSFINERGLKSHINMKHRDEPKHNPDGPLCETCDVRFASDTAYRQHLDVSAKHAIPGLLKRNTPRQDSGRYDKKTGTKAPSTAREVTCEECGVQIRGYRVYQRHFREEHAGKTPSQRPPEKGARSLCEQCGRSFKNIYVLRDHMLTHSGTKQYQCDMCKKTFYQKNTLVTHVKTHSELQPIYACPVCDKKFTNKANCNRHLWTHKEQKPFQCYACEKSFPNASTMRTHVAHAHFKKPYPRKSRGPRVRASRARGVKDAVCGTIWPKGEHATRIMQVLQDKMET